MISFSSCIMVKFIFVTDILHAAKSPSLRLEGLSTQSMQIDRNYSSPPSLSHSLNAMPSPISLRVPQAVPTKKVHFEPPDKAADFFSPLKYPQRPQKIGVAPPLPGPCLQSPLPPPPPPPESRSLPGPQPRPLLPPPAPPKTPPGYCQVYKASDSSFGSIESGYTSKFRSSRKTITKSQYNDECLSESAKARRRFRHKCYSRPMESAVPIGSTDIIGKYLL